MFCVLPACHCTVGAPYRASSTRVVLVLQLELLTKANKQSFVANGRGRTLCFQQSCFVDMVSLSKAACCEVSSEFMANSVCINSDIIKT